MIKLIHTADIHLDSPLKSLALRDTALREQLQSASRRAFTRIVDHALDEKVSALLISGDLFDGAQRSAKTAAFLLSELDRLAEKDTAVFYIKGNHDAENPVTGSLSWPANVHVFTARGGKRQIPGTDIWIHGVSFGGKHAPESLLDKFSAPVAGAINIGMLHTSLAGSAGHDVYAPCSVDELKSLGFDYWALGHIHKRQVHSDKPWIIMPGIPQGRDIGEAGEQSATLINVEQGQISIDELPTSLSVFLEHAIDISQVLDEEALRALLRRECQALVEFATSDSLIVRLRLTGRTALRWQLIRDHAIWLETLAGIANETGQLWIDKLILQLDTSATADERDSGAVKELEELMQEMVNDAPLMATLIPEVENVLAQLHPRQRAELLSDESSLEKLAAELANGGIEYVISLMRQGEL